MRSQNYVRITIGLEVAFACLVVYLLGGEMRGDVPSWALDYTAILGIAVAGASLIYGAVVLAVGGHTATAATRKPIGTAQWIELAIIIGLSLALGRRYGPHFGTYLGAAAVAILLTWRGYGDVVVWLSPLAYWGLFALWFLPAVAMRTLYGDVGFIVGLQYYTMACVAMIACAIASFVRFAVTKRWSFLVAAILNGAPILYFVGVAFLG
jgi:hypothetical protein